MKKYTRMTIRMYIYLFICTKKTHYHKKKVCKNIEIWRHTSDISMRHTSDRHSSDESTFTIYFLSFFLNKGINVLLAPFYRQSYST